MPNVASRILVGFGVLISMGGALGLGAMVVAIIHNPGLLKARLPVGQVFIVMSIIGLVLGVVLLRLGCVGRRDSSE